MTDKINQEPQDETDNNEEEVSSESEKPTEKGGPKGLEPTRYGDWERKGICYDF